MQKSDNQTIIINDTAINNLSRAYFGVALEEQQMEIIQSRIKQDLHNLLAQYIFPVFTEEQDDMSETYMTEQFMQTGNTTAELIEMGKIRL
jgi:hypothetical protein